MPRTRRCSMCLFCLVTLCTFLAACAGSAPDEGLSAETSPPPATVTEVAPPSDETQLTPTPQPAAGPTVSATVPSDTGSAESEVDPAGDRFLPLLGNRAGATATATPAATDKPRPTKTPVPTPTPTIDFAAVRQDLLVQGRDLAFVKIGFHTSVGGNLDGLGTWMRRLDAAGVPFFLKSADSAGPLFEAQEIARASGVPHTLVFRRSGDEFDVPNYDLPPVEAARLSWQLHRAEFPAELDPSLVWLETINEVDKNRSEWLAEFAVATAQLALAEGFRWAAFGWSSGEPEPEDWRSPPMLSFLRLAAEHPDRLAIALHEYSFDVEKIGDQYPFKIGRFQELFRVADQHGFPRPTVLITEWGWEYQNVPTPGRALRDMAWAAELYAPYPQIRGAATWHLGCCFADVDDQTQRLIEPLTEFSLGTYYAAPLPPAQTPIDPDAYRP